MKTLLLSLAAFFSCAAIAEEPLSETTVTELLGKMAVANRELSYRGIFTYEYGGVLKTVEVAHSVRDGLEYEKLIYLDGPYREVIRQGRSLDCQHAGDRLLRGIEIDPNGSDYTQLEDIYNLYIKGQGRIAGRPVIEVHVVPKDKYRYGYSLSIDRETGLLMRSMLVEIGSSGSKVLERFQFVSIEQDVMLSDKDLAPSVDDHLAASIDSTPCLNGAQAPLSLRQWRAAWLPPGFMLAGYQPKTETAGEALIYSDGLAVFSVFIDSGEAAKLPEIEASRGATFAFATRKGVDNRDFSICVVGEIPAVVAKQVAQSVTPLQ